MGIFGRKKVTPLPLPHLGWHLLVWIQIKDSNCQFVSIDELDSKTMKMQWKGGRLGKGAKYFFTVGWIDELIN